MITMAEIPSDYEMTPQLRVSAEWLYLNRDFAPDKTFPFGLSKEEETKHIKQCKIYKEKLIKFNSNLEQELKERDILNNAVVSNMNEARSNQTEIVKEIELLIDLELNRLSIGTGIKDTKLYEAWKINTKNNLWKLYGYGL